jgi:Raf kinase inhibitor-like YbhB/YbcL family protein
VALVVVAGCGGKASSPTAGFRAASTDTIEVTSTAFPDGGPIPERYTCDGAQLAPPLAWSGVPASAQAVALVVDDPDAPSGTYTHWVVLDIPVGTTSSDEGGVPRGGVEADNSAGTPSYAGPCPPRGTHLYRFTVFALDAPTGLAPGTPLDQAMSALDGHVVAWGMLTGTYGRP